MYTKDLITFVRQQLEQFGEVEPVAIHRFGEDECKPLVFVSGTQCASFMFDDKQVAVIGRMVSRSKKPYHHNLLNVSTTHRLLMIAERCGSAVPPSMLAELNIGPSKAHVEEAAGCWLGVVWRVCIDAEFVTWAEGQPYIDRPIAASLHTLAMLGDVAESDHADWSRTFKSWAELISTLGYEDTRPRKWKPMFHDTEESKNPARCA